MPKCKDATELIRQQAASFPGVVSGMSCNQTSFKFGKTSFLFIGPGLKGVGYKAMFKLDRSMPEARELATEDSEHFEVGGTGWVTVRFSNDSPLPKSLWQKWLKESYELSSAGGARAAKKAVSQAKRAASKATAQKTKRKTKSTKKPRPT